MENIQREQEKEVKNKCKCGSSEISRYSSNRDEEYYYLTCKNCDVERKVKRVLDNNK